MAHIIEHHIMKLAKKRVVYSIAIDATKVAKLLQICTKYNTVLSGIYLHHFKIASDNGNDNLLKKLKSILQNSNIMKADKIKFTVITFQNTRN